MAAAQSAPQQGADDAAKAAEAQKAAEAAKAAEAEKAKASDTAKPKPATASTPKGLVVTGAAVVLRADDGSERYLYRGAPVDTAAFSKDSIKHAKSVGLIGPAK